MFKTLINKIRFNRDCRKVSDLHDIVLDNKCWARTDVRLSGHVYDCHANAIADAQNAIAALASKWNADAETMRLKGI
ncbi:hypothetical protein [Rhizobium nepotum]|uniref:hypothetical protein n=1 Tax=Rhizobium nepotum TaxID=1035271 RepID=UPI003CF3D860